VIGEQPVRRPSPVWVMMFRSPSLFPWMTVWQNAELGLRFGGLPSTLPTRSFVQEDEVVRIGYIPITDATALLVAHANGYF